MLEDIFSYFLFRDYDGHIIEVIYDKKCPTYYELIFHTDALKIMQSKYPDVDCLREDEYIIEKEYFLNKKKDKKYHRSVQNMIVAHSGDGLVVHYDPFMKTYIADIERYSYYDPYKID